MSGDIELGYETNPGAVGANLGIIYFNNTGHLCYVLNDGVERPLMSSNSGDQTVSGNLSVTGTATLTGDLKPTSNGVPSLGASGLGFKDLFMDYTNTATVGNVTIHKSSGQCIVASLASAVTVTNNQVTANSHVFATPCQNDATGRIVSVVPAAGNFTINCVAPTANMAVNFFVVN